MPLSKDMNTTGIEMLAISVYKRYGAVQIKLFSEVWIKVFEQYQSVALFENAAQIQ